MHEQSFIFLPGISTKKELMLWNQGVRSWQVFLTTEHMDGLSWSTKQKHTTFLSQALQASHNKNAAWFNTYWPVQENWRLFHLFEEDALFLDIETGLRGEITTIGMMLHDEFYDLVLGTNLERHLFLEILSRAKMLVTFNGLSFDWPKIQRSFGVDLEIPHVDLRGVCSRAGFTGGLKHIERTLGIGRPQEIQGYNGLQAMAHFERYLQYEDREALQTFLEYNRYDTINLRTLAEIVIPFLWERTYKPNASVNCANLR